MGAVDWVIVGIVFVWAAVALFFVVRAKKKGKNCSCSGGGCDGNCAACSGCNGCDSRAMNEIKSEKNPFSPDADGKEDLK